MYDWKWSEAEKKVAHSVFEQARLSELAETLAEFKVRTASLISIDEMWPLEDYLRNRRQELDEKYDYRYSQLPRVFARLLQEGRVQSAQLAGLSEEKRTEIMRMASSY